MWTSSSFNTATLPRIGVTFVGIIAGLFPWKIPSRRFNESSYFKLWQIFEQTYSKHKQKTFSRTFLPVQKNRTLQWEIPNSICKFRCSCFHQWKGKKERFVMVHLYMCAHVSSCLVLNDVAIKKGDRILRVKISRRQAAGQPTWMARFCIPQWASPKTKPNSLHMCFTFIIKNKNNYQQNKTKQMNFCGDFSLSLARKQCLLVEINWSVWCWFTMICGSYS